MLDGRFPSEIYRTRAAGQVSASDQAHDQVAPRIWMSVAGLVGMICLVSLA